MIDQLKKDMERTDGAGIIQDDVVDMYEYIKQEVEPMKFLIDDLIPMGQVSLFIGEDGVGKTMILSELCIDVTMKNTSRFLREFQLNHYSSNSLIIATEDTKDKFHGIIRKQIAKKYPTRDKMLMANYEDVGKYGFIDAGKYDTWEEFCTKTENAFKNRKYDLVIFDAMGDAFTLLNGDINDSSVARVILKQFQQWANTYGMAIIITHHVAKSKIDARSKGKDLNLVPLFLEKNDSQGAGSITQKPRVVLALTNDRGSGDEDGTEYQNYIHVVKANVISRKYMKMAVALNFTSKYCTHEYADVFYISKASDPEAQNYIEQVRMKNDIYKASKLNIEPQKTESEKNLDVLLSHISKDDFAKGIQGSDLRSLVMLHFSIGEKKAKELIADLKDEGLLVMVGQKYYLQGQSISQLSSQDSINMFEQKEPEF